MKTIRMNRVSNNLDALSQIGRNTAGGVDRAFGSAEDERVRRWLTDYWTNLDLTVRVDAIGNLWAMSGGTEGLPMIAVGSHHDAVPNGGIYDGPLGVLLATELVETMREQGLATRHDLAVVSFTGEEPNPYNVSTLGSKVVSGRLVRADLEKLTSSITGAPLKEQLLRVGGDINRAEQARLSPNSVRAFLECHIEQGRRLFDQGLPLASVDAIIGIYRENITVIGESNHGGTTRMKDRHDALLAASELNLAFEHLIADTGMGDVVGTVGAMNVFPNSANVIPGVAELVLEIRAVDASVKDRIVQELDKVCTEIERRRGVNIRRRINLDQACVRLDEEVLLAVERAMRETGVEGPRLTSMAGHDAANMQRVTKAGMLFVQSIEGKSHCPEERTGLAEIEKAGNALLRAVMILDEELDR